MEASMRANGRWFTGPAILLGVAFALAGCDEDSGSIVREGDPALQVRGYSACDGNLLPVATLEDLTNDTLEYAQISATGIDPGRTSGAFEAGTAVKLYVGTNAGAPGGTGLRFRSTVSDTEPQGKTVADLVFAGDQVDPRALTTQCLRYLAAAAVAFPPILTTRLDHESPHLHT
jgi:hypothetical protein